MVLKMKEKIKVMIVDDSASVRTVLGEILNSNPDMELIATASDPIIAERLMKKQWPDVMILDIEMPNKDGVTFLKEIMRYRPTPIVMCSSIAEKDAKVTMEALSAGAVEIITKPKIGLKNFLSESIDMITEAVRSASKSNVKKLKMNIETELKYSPKLSADVILSPAQGKFVAGISDRFVALGASAGGTQATEIVLKALPKNSPGIVIVQHMPEKFTKAYASRLNTVCEVNVKEAENGDIIKTGQVIVAPGSHHMLVKRKGEHYIVEIKDGPPVSRHRPSVDVLFRSVAKIAGKNALGVILTGMGDDGAAGMLEMHNAGAKTVAQDKETCVVFGMPKEAIKLGGVEEVFPLNKIPEAILKFFSTQK